MKTCKSVSYGKSDAGNPHVRFDAGEGALAKPRRGYLLYEKTHAKCRVLFATVACFGAFAAVWAETISEDHVVLSADTVWNIPAGTTKHIEYLEATRSVQATVEGGGTLELAVVEAPDLLLRVKAGKLKVVRPVEMSTPSVSEGEWAYHFDASKASTIVIPEESVRDGVPALTCWNEVDGRKHPHHADRDMCLKTQSADSPRPYYRVAYQNGLNVVDLGDFYNKNAASAVAPACFLAFCGSTDKNTVSNHIEVFSVWQDYASSYTNTPGTGKTSLSGPQAMMGATAFYRGTGGSGKGYKLFANAGYSIPKGDLWLDNEKVTYSAIPDAGWHVLHARAVNGGAESNCGCLGMCGWLTYAGSRYGEIWAFSTLLDSDTSTRIRHYLQSKWLGPRIGRIEIRQDASYENVGLLRGEVLSVTGDSVWNDCDFVIDGATDVNGDGRFQTGEWRDLRHAYNTNSWTHQISRPTKSGTEDLTLLETGEVSPISSKYDATTYRQTYLSVHQGETTNDNGSVTFQPMHLALPKVGMPRCNAVTGTNDVYTMLFRFRVNRFCGTKGSDILWSNSWGSKATNGGPIVRVVPDVILEPQSDGRVVTNYWDAKSGRFTVYIGSYAVAGSSNLPAVTNGCWCEAAVVASNCTTRVYLAVPNTDMRCKTWTRPSTAYMTLAPLKCPMLLGAQSTTTATSTLKPEGSSNFDGDIALFATWSRALSVQEIREAFSRAGQAVMRVGLPSFSCDVFAGEENFAGEKSFACDAVNWAEMPRSLASGAQLNFDFRVPSYYHGLSQFLRIGTTAASSAGTIRATLNGETRDVVLAPGGVGTAHFPRKCFPTNTVLTLSLTRTDGGSEPLALDFAELTGNWRIGHWNNLSCMNSETYGWPDYRRADRNTMDMNGAATTVRTNGTSAVVSGTGKIAAVRFDVPADLEPATCAARIAFSYGSASVGTGNPSYLPCELKINGVAFGAFHIGTGAPSGSTRVDVSESGMHKRCRVSLPTGALRAGENTLTWSIAGQYSGHGWVTFSFLECEILTPKGCSFIIR